MKKEMLLNGFFTLMLVFAMFLTGCEIIGDMFPKDQPESPELDQDGPSDEERPDSPTAITTISISITAPVKGATPSTTASNSAEGGGNFTIGTVSWSPNDNLFLGNTVYAATLTLTANSGYTFAGLSSATINGQSVEISNNTGSAVSLSHTFPATNEKTATSIAIKNLPITLTYTHGDTLDLTGLAVTLIYDDNTTEDAAADRFADKNITANPSQGNSLVRSTHNGKPVVITYGDLTPLATGNLTVNPKVIHFTVDPIPAQKYTGSQIRPAVVVKDDTTILRQIIDYTVTYTDNINAGTAIVTISGVGNYAGSYGEERFDIIGIIPDDPNFFKGSRYEAKPYTGSNNGARNITGIDVDRIKYSFSYGGYDFYYIYLGVLANIPMFSFSTQEHFPSRPSDYTVTITDEIMESVSQSVSDSVGVARNIIDEYSRTDSTGHKLSYDLDVRFPIKKIFDFGIRAGAEHTWEQHIGNSHTTGFEETTSLTRTEERTTQKTRQTMQSRTFYLTSGMPAGFYRFTMFASSDVYLYVIRDSLTNELVHYELEEFVISKPEDSFSWNLDFSETKKFGKRDASSFEFDTTMLANLPPAGTVTVTFDKNNSDTDGAEVISQSIMVNIGGKAGNQMPEQPTRSEYSFIGWNTAAHGNGTPFTRDSKVTNNITVYAQWLHTPIHRFTLTANSTEGGTVNPPSVPGIFPETPVKITAAPSAHYRFVNWTVVSGTAKIINADNQDTTITLGSDATIRANFEPILYTLSVDRNIESGGTVNPTSKSDIAAGTSVSISATPAGHHRFVRWEVVGGGSEATTFANSNSASTTVTLNSNVTIRAVFELVQYRLTVERYPSNWGNVNRGSENHSALTPIPISASPNSGYKFVSWTVANGTATFDNANSASTTVTLSGNATIRANFLPTGAIYGGEVGKVSLENKGGFSLWLYVHWLDNNGVKQEYYSDRFNNPSSRVINPGDRGTPDGSWIRVFSWVASGKDKQGEEYFLYRNGNPRTAYYRHTGTTLSNTLHFDGVW